MKGYPGEVVLQGIEIGGHFVLPRDLGDIRNMIDPSGGMLLSNLFDSECVVSP